MVKMSTKSHTFILENLDIKRITQQIASSLITSLMELFLHKIAQITLGNAFLELLFQLLSGTTIPRSPGFLLRHHVSCPIRCLFIG